MDGDAVASVELDRAAEEADRGRAGLVVEDLCVGQAGGVVDRDVHELPAARASPRVRRDGAVGVVAPAAGDAMSGAVNDPSELLDVDVDQLAGTLALVALGGLQPSRPSLPIPIRVRIPETVESAIPRHSAISGPVNRNRRSAAIASTR